MSDSPSTRSGGDSSGSLSDISRRTALKAGGLTAILGFGVGAVAREWYPFGVGLPGHVRPDGDPPAIPPSLDETCSETDYTRLAQTADGDAIYWGSFPDSRDSPFRLRVDEPTYERGDRIEITLSHVGVWPREIGYPPVRHNLQVLTEVGWQDIRIVEGEDAPEEFGQPGTITAFPGRARQWSFSLTEDAIPELHVATSSMSVCPELPVGRYRFLCSAIGDWDDGIAVAFDVVG
jgi:hypothetical protein